MSAITVVDKALDTYLARMAKRGLPDPKGFRVSTLASIAHVDTTEMSTMLQAHRKAQANQPTPPGVVRRGRKPEITRYVVAARSYGQDARWRILAKPGSNPAVIRKARMEQAKWIARDAYSRIVRDLVYELNPALSESTVDKHVADTMELAKGQFETVVTHVERVLAREAITEMKKALAGNGT